MPDLTHILQLDDTVFFMHLPKTGGISFRTILENQFALESICPAQITDEIRRIPHDQLGSYRLFRGHFSYSLQDYVGRDFVWLTVLRHPIERTISHYRHIVRNRQGSEDMHDVVVGRNYDLIQFLEHPYTRQDTVNLQTRFISAHELNHDGIESIKRYGGVIEGIERLNQFAFVGLTEHFLDSLYLLAYTFGWYPVTQFQRLNTSPEKSRREDVTQAEIDAIYKHNAEDMALYEYAEKRFAEQYEQMSHTLLDEYGTAQHAHLKLPLEQDVIEDLLKKHYAACYAERRPPQNVPFRFAASSATGGENWHVAELDPMHGGVRWTGPGHVSRLDLPVIAEHDIQVRFRVMFVLDKDMLSQIELHVNNTAIPLRFEADETNAILFTGVIPAEILANDKPFTRVEFHLPRTIAPHEIYPNNPDERKLGILLNWIEFLPLAENETSPQ